MKPIVLKKYIKKINIIFIIIIVSIFCVTIFLSVKYSYKKVQNALHQQLEFSLLNIHHIKNNTQFLISYLRNSIVRNDNYKNIHNIQKILSSVQNSHYIQPIIAHWIDIENNLVYNSYKNNPYYIHNLGKIIPMRKLITSSYDYTINPHIINDMRFYHERLFSVVSYVQIDRKPVGYLLVALSLQEILNKININSNENHINISLIDNQQNVYTKENREPVLYSKFVEKLYKKLVISHDIKHSSFKLLFVYDKEQYLSDLINLMILNIGVVFIFYSIIQFYYLVILKNFIQPIQILTSQNSHKHTRYKIKELLIIDDTISQYYLLQNKYQILQKDFYKKCQKISYIEKMYADFCAKISHEMKTPLNIICLYTDIINEQIFGSIANKKYLDYAQQIHNASQQMLLMIEDVLFLNKIDHHNSTYYLSMLNIKDLIDNIIDKLSEFAATRKINIQNKIAANMPSILLDQNKTNRIFYHLIHNAIKFNYGVSVMIEAEIFLNNDKKKTLNISIKDNGSGISASDLQNILMPFYQADSGMDRKFEGLGIGLTIAKKFTEIQGGKLSIKSSKQGTIVQVNLVYNN